MLKTLNYNTHQVYLSSPLDPGDQFQELGKNSNQKTEKQKTSRLSYCLSWWMMTVHNKHSPVYYLPWPLFLQEVQVSHPVPGFPLDQLDQDLQEPLCFLKIWRILRKYMKKKYKWAHTAHLGLSRDPNINIVMFCGTSANILSAHNQNSWLNLEWTVPLLVLLWCLYPWGQWVLEGHFFLGDHHSPFHQMIQVDLNDTDREYSLKCFSCDHSHSGWLY